MSLNKVLLIGNVGQEPKIATFPDGKIANFTLATTERGFTTKDGRKVEDRTEWHNIVVRNRAVEVVEKYVKKGTPLFIEGKIATRSYIDNGGQKRYVTEIIASDLQLLGSKPKADNGADNRADNYRYTRDYPD